MYAKRVNSYSVEHKIQVIEWHKENGGNLHRTSKVFGVDRKSIRDWLKREDILRAYNFGTLKDRHKIGGGQSPLSRELDEELYQFYKNENENSRSVRNKILLEEARRIAVKLGLTDFKGSQQYIANFKRRYSIFNNNVDFIDSRETSSCCEVEDTIQIKMEKDSKKKNRKDSINISKIYETIKDKGFIQDLWLDVMSDLKEKPSYARLKHMVEKVIESAVDNYATKPKDHEERLKTRTIFTDLSIMTFTIDTLISELLHKKLKDEFKTIIGNIVEDLKNKDLKAKEDSNVDNMLENVEDFLCNGTAEKVEDKYTKGSKTSSTSKLPKKRIIPASDDLHVDNLRKDLRSKTGEHSIDIFNSNTVALSIVETEPEENSNTIMKKPKSENPISVKNGKRKLPTKLSKRRKAASNNSDISSEENYDIDIMNDDDVLSFDGNCSISSVSSVHTSDLSSFEDDVSISSEDEKGRKTKKLVPLHLAKEYFNKQSTRKLKKLGKKKIKLQSSRDFESSKVSKDSPSKRLSGRTRKPNSKYSSNDMLCTLRLIPQGDSSTSEKSEEDSPKEVFNSPKTENPTVPVVKKETRGRPRKSIPYHIKSFDQASEDSSDSDVSLKEDAVNKKNALQIISNVVSAKQIRKKGRPPKNRASENTVLSNNHEQAIKTNQGNTECNFTVPRPSISGTENGTHIIFKHKRGRPSKADLAIRNEILARSIMLDSSVSINKLSSQNNQHKPISSKNEPDSTRKKEAIVPDTEAKKTDDVPFKHSVESFSILEESLCLKDKQINQQNSPSKSSTKSYQASDLYKPRSDFRVSFNSRKGKAMTLFSN